MASFVTVSHAARQYKIQCTPSKILNDILVEACSRASLDSENYGLRYGKNNLDLSTSVRLAHLPGGAKIDLVAVTMSPDASVTIALNMPGSPRKIAAIPPSISLWRTLEAFESHYGLNILQVGSQRGGQLYLQQAVVQLMNKEYSNEEQLKSTTLASLGLRSGSAVLRVSFKPTDQLLNASRTSTALEGPVRNNSTMTDSLVHSDAKIDDNGDASTPVTAKSNGDVNAQLRPSMRQRNIEVLIPSRSNVPHYGTVTEPEDELTMSVAQAKAYQASLSSRSQSTAPLVTQKYRDQQALERREKARPDVCRVKFRFHDGTQVIGSFAPDEVASELYAFVRDLGESPLPAFELEVLGNRTHLPDDSQELWRDLYFVKAVAVQVRGDVRVKDEYKSQGKDAGQVVAQADQESRDVQQSSTTQQPAIQASAQTNNEEQKSEKKMPKWLQKTLGKR